MTLLNYVEYGMRVNLDKTNFRIDFITNIRRNIYFLEY